MKIFYGVQGTGNGHITRARVMAKELGEAGIDTTFQFTGRPADRLFDMEVFNGFQHRKGLTFNTDNGRVNYLKTLIQSSPVRFIQDVKSLDLSGYDLVISDFEPVTSWAAKVQNKLVLGIGHQYAFDHSIPKAGSDPLANLVMKYFAPVDIGIGLHWHHFDQPILPPIIEILDPPAQINRDKILVYLPFEDQGEVLKYLKPFTDFQFHVYSSDPVYSSFQHIECKPLSREGFQKDLYDCSGIISNAGFELASESLQLGKKILSKPLEAQMEQISNATVLKQLGYGHTMQAMEFAVIDEWLHLSESVRINYPNVARIIVNWIKEGIRGFDPKAVRQIWDDVEVSRLGQR